MGFGYSGNGDTAVPGLSEWDRFGYAVSVDRNRIAVGTPQTDTREPKPGKVYLFTREEIASTDRELTVIHPERVPDR